MAMCKTVWERLEGIAKEDSAREDRLGRSCPSVLTILLMGGHSIKDCHLVDGVNSLDDESIDVVTDESGTDKVWIVPLSAIAALHQTYPKEG